ncbi:polyprenyl synthetase family protein [Bacteroidota bacterium]
MHQFTELLKIIEDAIKNIPLDKKPNDLYQPIKYTMELGGKRLRPALCLMTCEMFDGKIEDALDVAIGIEVFHNFTLLHDDIMDDAPIRRGQASVFKKWDQNIAILSGDTMFALAMKKISESPVNVLKEVLEVFSQTAIEVCEGQQYDMDFESTLDVSIDEYLEMIRLKTAVLLGCSVKSGAIIAGTDLFYQDKIYDFAIKLGLAFQLKDDLLDTYGDEKVFGKKNGNDIVTNKKTYLLLKALEKANDDQKKDINFLLGHSSIEKSDKIKRMKSIYDQLNIKEETENKISDYFKQAEEILNKIDIEESKKEILIDFATYLMKRTK